MDNKIANRKAAGSRDDYTVELTNRNVLTVKFRDISAGWSQWLLLSSDRHHDNIRCRRDVELRHLKQARERNALIFDFGDLFCAMQGKYDPRQSMDDIRPEDVSVKYLDMIVDHAAEDYAPYADLWALMIPGNHETAILKKHHTSLLGNLARLMNREHGGDVNLGGFSGWVRFQFEVNKTKRKTYHMNYHHGYGGGGPVTKGVIQTNRQSVYLVNADFVVNGHTHDAWEMPIKRIGLSESGNVVSNIMYHIRIPGYKDDYGDGNDGWAVEKGMPPKPIGSYWVRFFADNSKSGLIGYEVISNIQ